MVVVEPSHELEGLRGFLGGRKGVPAVCVVQWLVVSCWWSR